MMKSGGIMSEFSEKCKELITKNNTNVYQLAKISGIERTTLQKMVTGSRLPISLDKVKEFCSYLQTSINEEMELIELYKKEKIGKKTYEMRREIRSLLLGAHLYQNDMTLRHKGYGKEKSNCNMDTQPVRLLEHELDISNAINYVVRSEVMSEEVAYVAMNTFDKNEQVYQSLMLEDRGYSKSIICNQYVNFVRSNRDEVSTIENIRVLKQIISFAFAFCHNYRVQYSYVAGNRQEMKEQVWPYFIVTSSKVLLLSGNCCKGILIEEIDLVRGYRLGVEELEAQYRLLFERGNSFSKIEDALTRYQESANGEFPEVIFSSHCNVMKMFYPQLYEKEKQNPHVQFMYDMYHENIKKASKSATVFFGLYEIEEFIKVGKLPGIYGEYTRNYTVEERRNMLNSLLRTSSQSSVGEYWLRNEFCDKDLVFDVELYGSKKLHIWMMKNQEGTRNVFEFIEIHEQGIYEAFLDYFIALKDNEEVCDMVLAPEELSNKINQLWSRLDKKE